MNQRERLRPERPSSLLAPRSREGWLPRSGGEIEEDRVVDRGLPEGVGVEMEGVSEVLSKLRERVDGAAVVASLRERVDGAGVVASLRERVDGAAVVASLRERVDGAAVVASLRERVDGAAVVASLRERADGVALRSSVRDTPVVRTRVPSPRMLRLRVSEYVVRS
jgi:hypothetical protein